MPIGAFCSPQPETEYNGKKYPNKVTEKYYRMLAELGVNLVYGHVEQIGGGDHEDYAFRALDYCHKAGIKYLVRDASAYNYVEIGEGGKSKYLALSAAEKAVTDKKFLRNVERYIHHPACAGICFYDEPGIASFAGIAAAHKVFREKYPDKIFYVNLSPNNVSPEQLEFGAHYSRAAESKDPHFRIGVPNDKRYEYYLQKYFEADLPDLISYDSYPFTTLQNVETVIHNTLWEIQQIVNVFCKKYNVPYWNFLQVGGKWDGWYREPDYSEMLLQVNVSLAYGAKGLELFPCVFPNDFLPCGDILCGVIDASGKTTKYYHWLKVILAQVKAVQKYLMNAKFENTILTGKFAGLLPPRNELDKIPWNEVIYDGILPKYGNCECESYRELRSAKATSQVLIGCFDQSGRTLFYLVNNSIVTAVNVKLVFDGDHDYTVIRDAKSSSVRGSEIYLQKIPAGDGVLIRVE